MNNMWKDKKFTSDADTVSPSWDLVSVKYHYSWMESQICKHITNEKSVFDVGSGYGHWLKFYKEIGFDIIEGLELSLPMAEKLNIYAGDIVDWERGEYEMINAIGILHHIMKDKDLIKAIENIKTMSKGLIFIGTRFDFFGSPKERNRKFRPLEFWEEHLNIIAIERNNSNKLNKHLDLLICKA